MLEGFPRRWRTEDGYVELVIAVVLACLSAAGAWVDDPSDSGRSGWWPAAVAAAAALVLVVRRLLPLTVLVVVLGLLVLVSVQGHQVGFTTVSLLFASHAVGRWAPGNRGLVGLGLIWSVFVALALTGDAYFSQPVAVVAPVVYALPFLVGRFVARRAERHSEEHLEARVAERAQLARELHDVVSHALTGISVQAGTARHLGLEGAAATETLGRIEVLSRQALGDLRRMLELLREDSVAPGSPAPTIGDLPALVEAHVAVHGPVELELEGSWSGVEPSVELVVYRLVQEALTNVARHARGAPARVFVRRAEDGIFVVVEDEGSGSEAPGPGAWGIVGMRERVTTYGGTFEAGPRVEGGYAVRARIPTRP